MGANYDDLDANVNEIPKVFTIINKGFYMAKTQVTLDQFRSLSSYAEGEYRPVDKTQAVNYISWMDAMNWLNLLNLRKPNNEINIKYRLPSEAEWEYACRGGNSTRFYYGDDHDYALLNKYCWYSANTWDLGLKHPQSVGQKIPNDFGLYDMHGNVWEWTSDGWANYSEIRKYGQRARDLNQRVIRGGGWCHEAKFQRASDRDHYRVNYKHYYTGFRVCFDCYS